MTIEEMKLHYAIINAPVEAVAAVLELEPLAALAAQVRSAEQLTHLVHGDGELAGVA